MSIQSANWKHCLIIMIYGYIISYCVDTIFVVFKRIRVPFRLNLDELYHKCILPEDCWSNFLLMFQIYIRIYAKDKKKCSEDYFFFQARLVSLYENMKRFHTHNTRTKCVYSARFKFAAIYMWTILFYKWGCSSSDCCWFRQNSHRKFRQNSTYVYRRP